MTRVRPAAHLDSRIGRGSRIGRSRRSGHSNWISPRAERRSNMDPGATPFGRQRRDHFDTRSGPATRRLDNSRRCLVHRLRSRPSSPPRTLTPELWMRLKSSPGACSSSSLVVILSSTARTRPYAISA